jgi:hypothetical protein
MIRTQIYITDQERQSLAYLVEKTGKSQSELIRNAIDLFCMQFSKKKSHAVLKAARGLWETREDLPDFSNMRKEWDRYDNKEQ